MFNAESNEQRINRYTKLGVYFGYPKCCVANFIERDLLLTADQEKVHKNTGFTPCPSCSAKILAGTETLESLLKDRKHFEQFPYDDLAIPLIDSIIYA